MKHNETTEQNRTTTTTVKNPNWPEANQLAIYKCSWEVEPGTTRIKFNECSERVLNPGSPDLKASALTTGPHCLSVFKKPDFVTLNCFYRRRRTDFCSNPDEMYVTISHAFVQGICLFTRQNACQLHSASLIFFTLA